MKARERIYIVPTLAGLVLAGIIFLIFAVGYFLAGFGGPLHVVVMALLVAGIVVLIQTNDNLRGIHLECRPPLPTPVGGEVILPLTVTNHSSEERLGLRVRWRERWRLHGNAWIPVVRPGETIQVELRFTCRARGLFEIPALWVSSTVPAGLCFAWKAFTETGRYAVYPAGKGWRGLPENPAERAKQGGEDVEEHRPYRPGDPVSRVDWKVFAKSGNLAVRTFQSPNLGKLELRWEDTAFLTNPEDRLEQLSFWIQDCIRSVRPFQLQLGGETYTENQLTACWSALAMHKIS